MTQQPDNIKPGDERRLAELYRESASEMPPPALDHAILESARIAAAQSRRQAPNENMRTAAKEPEWNDPRPEPRIAGGRRMPAGTGAPVFAADAADAPRTRREEQRWGKPLALAAAVVLGIGVVVRLQMQSPNLEPPASEERAAAKAEPTPAPAAPAPAAQPQVAMQDKAAPAQPAAPPAAAAPAEAESGVAAGGKAEAMPEQAEPAPERRAKAAARPAERETLNKDAPVARRSRLDSAAQNELAREESDRKLRDQANSELSKLQAPAPVAAAAAPAAKVEQSAADSRARAALGNSLPEAGNSAGSRYAVPAAPAMAPPPAPAKPAPSVAAGGIDPTVVPQPPLYESDPGLWAQRIVDLRRGGRATQADAELRRLRARYPNFKVPADALAPAP